MSASSSPTTGVWENRDDFTWEGKDPHLLPLIGVVSCTDDFGKSIGWEVLEGRDFSDNYKTDSTAVILNEAAVRLTGLKNIIGKIITDENNKKLHVIAVVKDLVMESPYAAIKPTFFVLGNNLRLINIKLSPNISIAAAINRVQTVYKAYNPDVPFDSKFADEEFNRKFNQEERLGKLAAVFGILAVFVSCLGLYGLTSFITEQRIKEIGIRKVLGASVSNLWQMLSKEFVLLVLVSFLLAVPISYSFMTNWLLNYEYRTYLSWWIFAIAGTGAFVITILTVSVQSIKAARANPVKSLRAD